MENKISKNKKGSGVLGLPWIESSTKKYNFKFKKRERNKIMKQLENKIRDLLVEHKVEIKSYAGLANFTEQLIKILLEELIEIPPDKLQDKYELTRGTPFGKIGTAVTIETHDLTGKSTVYFRDVNRILRYLCRPADIFRLTKEGWIKKVEANKEVIE